MLTTLIQRFGQALVTVAAMATLVFVGVYAIADPIDMLAAPDATPDERAAISARLGLDRSLPVQFGTFAWRALHGDLGRSFVYNEPALSVILQRLPATLELALTALMLAVAVGLPLGLWAGLKPSSGSGRTIMTGSILAFSLPNFWQGLMLVLVFAVTLGWFPAGGRGETVNVLGIETGLLTLDGLRHLVLPAVNLALFKLAVVIRLARAGTREAMLQDYVRFARAKGLSPARIVGVHVLKNILLPVVTVIGLELGSMIAFAVVTETVFAWPGIGKLLIDSINRLDRPVIVAYLMLTVCLFVVINLIVDLIYAALDPRVRLSEAA
ncbi:ABC transporter permease [Methylobacterium sp. E-025]|uniref:ABC transporter permease n=1 Tax=Methylobacterium sp. E-025 TaxID=2836561 RepID=UPI001FB9ECFB|nr:ABC transporter permease [Methylobacterium sp. E-025]MCJ2113777.1 ABC transporter permease [Methylobacterium sp. E-025]